MSTPHPPAPASAPASAPAPVPPPGRREAVVTGVGLAVPGLSLPDELLGAVREGGFDPRTGLLGRDLRHKDRASRLALRGAAPALRDAGLLGDDGYTGEGDSTAVVVSSNFGILESVCSFADIIARDTVRGLSPVGLPQTSSNVIAGSVAMAHGLRGPSLTLCNGPTSGLDAIDWARLLIVSGRATTALVIGVEPDGDAVTKLLGAATLDGAVALVVESGSRAAERGARVRATVDGCARAADLAGAVTGALGSRPGPDGAAGQFPDASVDLWLTDRQSRDGDVADGTAARPPVRADAVVDPAAPLGLCSGALGVLQAAAAVAHFDEHTGHTALATCGGPGDDAVAALFLGGPRRTA
ncbi:MULTISPECIES: beta-ketoacyl synthase N-terminal-like domain-containing protein [unclassified Streptomyces]|uniref:beta-ketoacyl synthase N-terminal-like domain-containing protein n=1 Tax=unclassified Streptomyces TaxID=2593676 RepID=UPI0022B6F0A6|nr:MULTISPECIES: beta-ketoacyl synthase N-terminal-like domain-containing protein [unclassified Streptomyces]MCZ7417482.1 beta-ketoacyl synthase N-terminal-like domain-containing protein [Streptomyces sp. WMMC897]MCZ7432689.1 beta-ketoacyl synthase N-terminal-like domain-containing protein [Streptomyces sp. WMMC1477]